MTNPELNFKKDSCSCGPAASNKNIRHKCQYSGMGMILYWIGISAKPIRVDFQCGKCGEIIESSDEPALMRKFVGR